MRSIGLTGMASVASTRNQARQSSSQQLRQQSEGRPAGQHDQPLTLSLHVSHPSNQQLMDVSCAFNLLADVEHAEPAHQACGWMQWLAAQRRGMPTST
jgi:hypothetical protein